MNSDSFFNDLDPLNTDNFDFNFNFNDELLTGNLDDIDNMNYGQSFGFDFDNTSMIDDISSAFNNESSSLESPQNISSVNSFNLNCSSSRNNNKKKKRKKKNMSITMKEKPSIIKKKKRKMNFFSKFEEENKKQRELIQSLRKKYKPLSSIVPSTEKIKEYYKKVNKKREKKYNKTIKLQENNRFQLVTFLKKKNEAYVNFENINILLNCFQDNKIDIDFNLDNYTINNKLSIQVLLENNYLKYDEIIKLKNIIFDYLRKDNKLFHFADNRITLFSYYICYGNLELFELLKEYLINYDIERDFIKNEIILSKKINLYPKCISKNRKHLIEKFIENIQLFKCSNSKLLESEYKNNIDFIKKNEKLYEFLKILNHPFMNCLITKNMLTEWLRKLCNYNKNINFNEGKTILEFIFNYYNKIEIFPDDFKNGFIIWMRRKINYILSKKFGLLNHQSIAISHTFNMDLFIADDMGLGKTASSIVATLSNESIKNVFIICPPVLIPHWKQEIKKWSYECHENICIYDKKSIVIYKNSDNNVKNYLLLSHSFFLIRDHEKHSNILQEYTKKCDCLILDELHIYSTGAKWSKRLINFTNNINKSCKLIALSGTPIRQRLSEMSHLLRIFRKVKTLDYKHKFDIIKISSIFLSTTIRRTKEMIFKGNNINIPEVETKEVFLPLDTLSKERYSMIKSILSEFRHSNGRDYIPLGTFCLLRQLCVCFDSINEEIKRLLKEDILNIEERRNICNRLEGIKDNGEDCSICLNPLENVIGNNCSVVCTKPCGHAFHKKCINKWLVKNKNCPLCRQFINATVLSSTFYNETKKAEKTTHSKEKTVVPKFEWILQKCKEEKDNKFIIFSEFIKPLKLLKEYLDNNDIKSCIVIGSDKNTSNIIESFKNNKKIQVLLATKKCSVGLNLTVANRVIFLSVPLSVNIDKQSKDRINRIGQKKKMEVTYLITKDSFEVELMKQLKKKN